MRIFKKKERKKTYYAGYECPCCLDIIPENRFYGDRVGYIVSLGLVSSAVPRSSSVCRNCGADVNKKWKKVTSWY